MTFIVKYLHVCKFPFSLKALIVAKTMTCFEYFIEAYKCLLKSIYVIVDFIIKFLQVGSIAQTIIIYCTTLDDHEQIAGQRYNDQYGML